MINLNAPFLREDGRTVSQVWAAFLSDLAQNNNVVVSFNGRMGTVRLAGSDVTQALGFTPANSASVVLTFNGRNGSVTLSGADVLAALGYTPANQSNAALTGTPTAPTAAPGTNTTQIATTAFVQAALPAIGAWQTPALLNGWVDYGAPFNPVGYCVDAFGIVRLRGLAKSGTVGTTTPIFQLPTGLIPPNQCAFAVQSNNTIGRVDVDASGNVIVVIGTNAFVSLDGIAFRNA